MTLGEFWERNYFYEHSRADNLHFVRLIMSSSLSMKEGSKLKDIIYIPIIDDAVNDYNADSHIFTEEEIAEKMKKLPSTKEIFEQMDKKWERS